MLKCEKCGGYKLETSDSRNKYNTEYTRRRKVCKECGYSFTTVEIAKSQYDKYISYMTKVNELTLKVRKFIDDIEVYKE